MLSDVYMDPITSLRPSLVSFADYVETHKEVILTRWSHRVAQDNRILSTQVVDSETLLDHVSEILLDLCNFFRERVNIESADVVTKNAAIYGLQRWTHGYSLKDLLLELEKLRKILLIDLMHEYYDSQPGINAQLQRKIEHSACDFFGELIIASVTEYTQANESKLSSYSKFLYEKNNQLNSLNTTLRNREARILELSLTDSLTKVANRRQLETRLHTEIKRSQRYAEPLVIVMLDLDHFKPINDQYGHEVGDHVLKSVATCIHIQLRAIDFIARYGGEEFILLLPNTLMVEAQAFVARIRQSISELVIKPLKSPVTASLGLAQWRNGENAADFMGRADNAMYRAKADGRNCIKIDNE